MPRSLRKTLSLFAGLPLSLWAAAGCDLAKSALPTIAVEGAIQVDGDAPSAYSLTLYAWSENLDAFDTSYCLDASDTNCLGRVDVGALTTPVTGVTVDQHDGVFSIDDVPSDVLYILVATSGDSAIACSTDVIGFDEETKVVTYESAITWTLDDNLETFVIPRDILLYCHAPATEPEAPAEPEPEEDVGGGTGGEISEGEDPVGSWTSFLITDKTGATTYADASAGNAVADVECGDSFPSVLQIQAEAVNTSASQAYIRIQFGSGEDAEFRTVETPISGGRIDQSISLTGGYAVVQLDLDETLDGVGESFTATFCDRDDPPAQEMLTILTWDKDDTDVDTHIASDSEEIAYYNLRESWGELDIDDVDGFGPETFSSTSSESGRTYEVKVHYYSDHGNGPTTATLRAVYYDPDSGQICDITASQEMDSYEWWVVGTFGPGMDCPG